MYEWQAELLLPPLVHTHSQWLKTSHQKQTQNTVSNVESLLSAKRVLCKRLHFSSRVFSLICQQLNPLGKKATVYVSRLIAILLVVPQKEVQLQNKIGTQYSQQFLQLFSFFPLGLWTFQTANMYNYGAQIHDGAFYPKNIIDNNA